jgi:uncharacterized protein YdgA (DUF945 family)
LPQNSDADNRRVVGVVAVGVVVVIAVVVVATEGGWYETGTAADIAGAERLVLIMSQMKSNHHCIPTPS